MRAATYKDCIGTWDIKVGQDLDRSKDPRTMRTAMEWAIETKALNYLKYVDEPRLMTEFAFRMNMAPIYDPS